MKHVVIGTAGHIDHGKTTLIKALTSIDCDRLKEEKERGITIDLGFAYFDLPSGRRAGIVDVPGHERFIKNMLAGVGGMDLVLLIVSADEGVMPQTTEHLHILSLLQVKKGIVVVTKADLVDDEWLELVMLDIREKVQGTFLAEAPIVPVSAVTKAGLAELTGLIDKLYDEVGPKDAELAFRLPIDRVFTVQGFGTVVTGTLLSGEVRVGDVVELQPSQLSVRIRGVGVHGKQVDKAEAGQRTALNLAGVSVEQVRRGDILCAPRSLFPTLMVDVRLNLLADLDKMLINRERVRLYVGTAEILCRVVLLDVDTLLPGESAYAQLRLEEPTALRAGDRFVIRSYSPMVTIGGGTVLDPSPVKRKRFKEKSISELKVLESGSTAEVLAQKIARVTDRLLSREELRQKSQQSDSEEALEALIAEDIVVEFRADDTDYLLHRDTIKSLNDKLVAILEEYHRRYPLRLGIQREELRNKLFPAATARTFGALLLALQGDRPLRITKTIALNDFEVKFTGKWQKPRETVLSLLSSQLFSPPALDEMIEAAKLSGDDLRELLDALVEAEELIKVTEGMYFARSAVCKAKELVQGYFASNNELTLAEFRTLIDSSRKYALPLLEFFDQRRLTMRAGESRKLNSSFDSTNLPC